MVVGTSGKAQDVVSTPRATPRPLKVAFIRSAVPSPTSSENTTTAAVYSSVVLTVSQNSVSWISRR